MFLLIFVNFICLKVLLCIFLDVKLLSFIWVFYVFMQVVLKACIFFSRIFFYCIDTLLIVHLLYDLLGRQKKKTFLFVMH
jgi:hypothetical protein